MGTPILISNSKKMDAYLCMKAAELKTPGLLADMMDLLIGSDRLVEKFHRQALHGQIGARFAHSKKIRHDRELFELWRALPRIAGIKKPPKDPNDTFRAMCCGTYDDPTKASKIWCRLEHLWIEDAPVEKVTEFLATYGLETRVPGSLMSERQLRKVSKAKERKAAKKAAALAPKLVEEKMEGSKGPCVAVITNVPSHIDVTPGTSVTMTGKFVYKPGSVVVEILDILTPQRRERAHLFDPVAARRERHNRRIAS